MVPSVVGDDLDATDTAVSTRPHETNLVAADTAATSIDLDSEGAPAAAVLRSLVRLESSSRRRRHHRVSHRLCQHHCEQAVTEQEQLPSVSGIEATAGERQRNDGSGMALLSVDGSSVCNSDSVNAGIVPGHEQPQDQQQASPVPVLDGSEAVDPATPPASLSEHGGSCDSGGGTADNAAVVTDVSSEGDKGLLVAPTGDTQVTLEAATSDISVSSDGSGSINGETTDGQLSTHRAKSLAQCECKACKSVKADCAACATTCAAIAELIMEFCELRIVSV